MLMDVPRRGRRGKIGKNMNLPRVILTVILIVLAAAALGFIGVYYTRFQSMNTIEKLTDYEDGYNLYRMDILYDYDLDRIIDYGMEGTSGGVSGSESGGCHQQHAVVDCVRQYRVDRSDRNKTQMVGYKELFDRGKRNYIRGKLMYSGMAQKTLKGEN